jgi:Tfp pilus assembly protein PilF
MNSKPGDEFNRADADELSPSNGLPWSRGDALALILLLVLPAIFFGQALSFGFVYDDEIFVINNPLILSWKSLPGFFTQSLTSWVHPGLAANYYRPVLFLWLLINRTLWGLSAFGWHLSTLFLHVLVTLSVYWLARKILRDRLSAALASAVFAVLPIHVETVAWVMGFPDSLVALAVVTSFLCYLNGRPPSRHRVAWLAGSTLLFALGIFTRENAVALPVIIAVWEWIRSPQRGGPQLALRKGARIRACLDAVAPYLAVTGIYLVVRVLVLGSLSHAVTRISLTTLAQTLPLVIATYLKHLFWPVGLSAFYDIPYVEHPGLGNFWLPVGVLLATGAGLGWWSKKSRHAALASLWLVVPALPVLNLRLLPPGEPLHDRYMYLPSVGLVLLLGLGLRRLGWGGRRLLGQPAAPLVCGTLLVALLGFETISYGRYWSDNLTLYRRGVEIAPQNNIVNNNLANEFVARGRYDEAIRRYRQVLSRSPDFWLSNYNLGFCYYKLNQLDAAQQFLGRAIAIDPTNPDQFVYLGLTKFKMGRLGEAESAIRHAIAIRPDGRGFHFALGVVLKTRGEPEAALQEFRSELRYYPDQAAAQKQIEEVEDTLKKPPSP